MNSKSLWSNTEFEMINVVDVFRYKPGIMKKAEELLTELKEVLVEEMERSNLIVPPETDVTQGQIARGENYKGFPFISLDMPQRFSKTEMFTFRTVFWWGHCLVFSFILKGGFVPSYCENIITRKDQSSFKGIYLAIGPNPFEWELNDENYRLVAELSDANIRSTIQGRKFMKLASFISLSDPAFKLLDWKTEGLVSFQTISQMAFAN